MIIHPITMESIGAGVRISARIEWDGQQPQFDTLWFEFPESAPAAFSGHPDGFVVAMLLLAMARREDIHVLGSLDRQLLSNLVEYQRIFHAWFPDLFQPVGIHGQGSRIAEKGAGPRGVGSAFSGGVDSSYTLWSHLPDNEPLPDRRISHALFVHGFDIPLADTATFEAAASRYRRELQVLGVELVTARTNIRQFVDVLPWELLHGSALGAVVLMLDRLLGLFYVPASVAYDDLQPWGSHPVADPLLATATMTVIHDGCMVRFDKVATVSRWAPARSWLRVCWVRPDANRNCCRCYGCVLTMIALDIAGTLPECPTFPGALDRSTIRRLHLPSELRREIETLIGRVNAAGRPELAQDLRVAWRSSCVRHRISAMSKALKSMFRRGGRSSPRGSDEAAGPGNGVARK